MTKKIENTANNIRALSFLGIIITAVLMMLAPFFNFASALGGALGGRSTPIIRLSYATMIGITIILYLFLLAISMELIKQEKKWGMNIFIILFITISGYCLYSLTSFVLTKAWPFTNVYLLITSAFLFILEGIIFIIFWDDKNKEIK